MDQGVYDKLYELEHWYWWFVGRVYVMEKVLDNFFPPLPADGLTVDFGCGTGGAMEMLARRGQVLGLDIEPRALEFCKSKGFPNVALMKGFYDTGLADNSADLVTALDVLEHFEDDERALREISRVVKPGGYVLITVPALQFLWSELDDYAHHFRRYTRTGLEEKLSRAGFVPIKSSYLFFFVLPLVSLYRFVGNMKKKQEPKFKYVEFPKLINKALLAFSKLEAVLLKFINFSIGSTVMILAKKRD